MLLAKQWWQQQGQAGRRLTFALRLEVFARGSLLAQSSCLDHQAQLTQLENPFDGDNAVPSGSEYLFYAGVSDAQAAALNRLHVLNGAGLLQW